MIGKLYGTVCERGRGSLLFRAGPVAYRVHVLAATEQHWPADETTERELFTHLAVRENAQELYGFETREELDFFELLLSVPGIGPKSALAVLNLADTATLQRAINAGDSAYLTRVSGIGRKSAEKIVLELRDKLGALSPPEEGAMLREEAETLEALQALGYGLREAREALKHALATEGEAKDLLKASLKALHRPA